MVAAVVAVLKRQQNDYGSFSEDRLDTEPHRAENAGHDNRNDGTERVILRLLHAPAPPSKIAKIGSQLPPIVLVDAERRQHCRDRLQNDRVDFAVLDALLLGEGLGHDRSYIIDMHEGNTSRQSGALAIPSVVTNVITPAANDAPCCNLA